MALAQHQAHALHAAHSQRDLPGLFVDGEPWRKGWGDVIGLRSPPIPSARVVQASQQDRVPNYQRYVLALVPCLLRPGLNFQRYARGSFAQRVAASDGEAGRRDRASGATNEAVGGVSLGSHPLARTFHQAC
eukprot:561657-Hanusia_phi.AAC.2